MGFFSLKAVSPIDLHYMTDRLQRFELKIFVSVQLKKQSHLHLGCPGGKQTNITLLFVGELSNTLWLKYLNVFTKFRSDILAALLQYCTQCSVKPLRGPGLMQLWAPLKQPTPAQKWDQTIKTCTIYSWNKHKNNAACHNPLEAIKLCT